MKNEIPGLVRAQVQVHLSETAMKLERVRAELDRTTVSTARSRVLRDQLTAQRDAWEYLATMIESEHYQAYRDVNSWGQADAPAPLSMCTICGHDPHGVNGCGAGCGCDGTGQQVRANEPENDPDTECVCTHPRHAHNPRGLCVMIPGVTGCGCLGFLDRREYRG